MPREVTSAANSLVPNAVQKEFFIRDIDPRLQRVG